MTISASSRGHSRKFSADITEVLTQLDGFVRRVDSDIDEFTKLAHRLQDEITQARMVPIGNLYTRLSRTVRDAAKAANKQVELTLAGAETELDNNIIQQISDPLIHLVRNSWRTDLSVTMSATTRERAITAMLLSAPTIAAITSSLTSPAVIAVWFDFLVVDTAADHLSTSMKM